MPFFLDVSLATHAKRENDKNNQPPYDNEGYGTADYSHVCKTLGLFQFDKGAEEILWMEEKNGLVMGADLGLAIPQNAHTL